MQTVVKVSKYLGLLFFIFVSCSTSKINYSNIFLKEGKSIGISYEEDIKEVLKDTCIMNSTFKTIHIANVTIESTRNFLKNYKKKDSVEHIRISHVDSLHLSDILCEYKNLNRLRINNCSLTQFSLYCKLINLQYLNLSNNKLDENCFESIANNFPNVGMIYIDDNLIKSLPHSLIKLEKLRYLGVSNNPISSIDLDILSNINRLRYLYIRNTLISEEECIKLNLDFNIGKTKEDKMKFYCN